MFLFNFLKNLPGVNSSFFVPLAIALGLHGMVLMMPISADSNSSPTTETEETEETLESESFASQQNQTVEPSPTPSPSPSPQPTPSLSPTSATVATRSRQVPHSSPQTAPTATTQPTTTPENANSRSQPNNPAPEATTQHRRQSTRLTQRSRHNRTVPALETARQSPTSTPTETRETVKPSFPYYPGSLVNSGGILKSEYEELDYVYHTFNSIGEVAPIFELRFRRDGFEFEVETETDNFKVYRVSDGKGDRFLHLIRYNDKTAIVLTDKPKELSELVKKEKPDPWLMAANFYLTFKQSILENSDLKLQKIEQSQRSLFPEAAVFQKMATEEKEPEFQELLLDRLAAISTTDDPIAIETLADTISQELQSADPAFTMKQIDIYRGGNLYKISNEAFEAYAILLVFQPNEGTARTGIFFSKTDPRDRENSNS
jgi:hypothetical protein